MRWVFPEFPIVESAEARMVSVELQLEAIIIVLLLKARIESPEFAVKAGARTNFALAYHPSFSFLMSRKMVELRSGGRSADASYRLEIRTTFRAQRETRRESHEIPGFARNDDVNF
jgi:hypothetical protein